MKVFKFGGASVKDVDGVKNVGKIVQLHQNEKLLIVVSAMGKTTNALEAVVKAFLENKNEEAIQLFTTIKQQHLTTAKYLLVKEAVAAESLLNDLFTEVEWLLHDKPVQSASYYYDQIVSIGELISTAIVSAYLKEIGLLNKWIDIRDYLKTDNNFRDATIDWTISKQKIETFNNELTHTQIVLTQGFIGSTLENETTTLGREGSDYTAAVIANICNAQSVTIWKDVKGVLNADPKEFADATLLPHLSYNEIIEMAFYGAQVIHPKTIKPIHNKNIPLYVKCFLDSELPGTIIDNQPQQTLPPIIIIKRNQVLLHLQSKDFSFVGEKPMSQLYSYMEQVKVKSNLTQSGAIGISICVDDVAEKIETLALMCSDIFDVTVQRNLTILTVRHYNQTVLEQLTSGKAFIMQQKTQETYQALFV
jgi:aspartate kinase